jgi:hypothetical protein
MLLISGLIVGHTPSVADVQCPVPVGRDAELGALTDAAAAARACQGQAVRVALGWVM